MDHQDSTDIDRSSISGTPTSELKDKEPSDVQESIGDGSTNEVLTHPQHTDNQLDESPSETPDPTVSLPTNYHVVSSVKAIFFQRQTKRHCAIHAVNNLCQQSVFDTRQFDKIADQLAAKIGATGSSMRGFMGNYDANVLLSALDTQNFGAFWVNLRKFTTSQIRFDHIHGIIINIKQPSLFFFTTRHWLALVPFLIDNNSSTSNGEADSQQLPTQQPTWFDLNSELSSPRSIPSMEEYLQTLVDQQVSEYQESPQIILVYKKDILHHPDVHTFLDLDM